ncbi:MAG: hypothetical protein WDW38_004189 [Sanguina aurantia]
MDRPQAPSEYEIGDLRKTLNTEVDSLRSEFMNLKVSLKQQLELTAGLAAQEISEAEERLAGIYPPSQVALDGAR